MKTPEPCPTDKMSLGGMIRFNTGQELSKVKMQRIRSSKNFMPSTESSFSKCMVNI